MSPWKRWQMDDSWGFALVPFWACLSGWGASQTRLPTPGPPVLPQPHLVPLPPPEDGWSGWELFMSK